MRPIVGRALCVYSRARSVRDPPLALIWPRCAGLSFGEDLNVEQTPVLDMPLAEETAARFAPVTSLAQAPPPVRKGHKPGV